MKKVRALVVDDSALMRQMLTEFLNADPEIEVVGTAGDPYVARERIKQLNPDVLTLDVEMPRMDGLTFLDNLMRLRPMPVVMVSSLTQSGAEATLRALELGAVDFVSKPVVDLVHELENYRGELTHKVKTASRSRIAAARPADSARRPERIQFKTTDRLIAIGASTGGTEAIRAVLTRLPASSPAVVIAQHMPEAFSAAFAKRMDSLSAMTVEEAKSGVHIVPGHAYLAPGNHHLEVHKDGARWVCDVHQGEKVSGFRPSVDVLFRSVARSAAANSVGVLLTGMGSDGAQGLLEMREAGAATIAQDEATSVVWGMPGSAVKLGAARHVLPIERVASRIAQEMSCDG